MLRKIIGLMLFFTIVLSLSVRGEESVETLLEQGKNTKDTNVAVDRYWRAARLGSAEALDRLSVLYATELKNTCRWDPNSPRFYLQETADKFYNPQAAEPVECNFVIVCDEQEIVNAAIAQLTALKFDEKQYGIYPKKFGYWGWARRHRAAIAVDSLRKDIAILGKNESRFACRSRKLGSGEIVALVDTETAKANFNFHNNVTPQSGQIYARGVTKDLLVPLNDYIEYRIDAEMSALKDICNRLGAKSITVEYVSAEKDSGAFKQSISNQEQSASVTCEEEIFNRIQGLCKVAWSGNNNPQKFNSKWFGVHPEWKEMYDFRHNNGNPLKEWKLTWNFEKMCSLSSKISAAVEKTQYETTFKNKWNRSFKVLIKIEFP